MWIHVHIETEVSEKKRNTGSRERERERGTRREETREETREEERSMDAAWTEGTLNAHSSLTRNSKLQTWRQKAEACPKVTHISLETHFTKRAHTRTHT